MHRNRRIRGFSMIELVVVGAIILLIAAIATPTVMRSINTYRLGGAASDLYNMLQRARYEAIRRNTTITCRNRRMGSSWVVWVDMNNNGMPEATEPMSLLPSNAQFVDPSTVPSSASMGFRVIRVVDVSGVAFDFRGQVNFGANPPAVLVAYIGAPNQPTLGFRAISITPAGKMKIWKAAQRGPWIE
jgi:prepilin-type N-terminal cleavage/methylation domain-containing protein